MENKYLIEVRKNNRTFFITESIEFTWMKSSALLFNSIEELNNEISNNRLLELKIGSSYTFKLYKDAKNH